jgi:5-formyltetrahydrofolate cyclo-ligase
MTASAADLCSDIRLTLRRQRMALSSRERGESAERVAHVLQQSHWLRPRKKIAVYLASRGEVDLGPVIRLALKLRCDLYAPRVISQRAGRMQFVRIHSMDDFTPGAFGIDEPLRHRRQVIKAIDLDMVLMPLVAFDRHGTRLGMGAGFYDRCFGRLAGSQRWRKPRLIGIGYDFQQVADLERRSWDVPLDAAITDRGIHRFELHAAPIERAHT